MGTRDEPLDPEEVLAAAEAAHLAARETVPIPGRGGAPRRPRDRADPGPHPDRRGRQVPRPRPGLVPSPRQPGVPSPRRRPPLPLAALVAAGWAALLSFLPVGVLVVLVQAAAEGPFVPAGAVTVAAAGWLLAHGVPLGTAAGPVGLVPLALAGLAGWRLARAGVHVTRARGWRGTGSYRDVLVAAIAVAVGYGAVGALVAMPLDRAGVTVYPVRAGLTLACFGFVAAALGALSATGAGARLAAVTPKPLRDAARTGLVAATLVLAAGAGVAGLAIAWRGGDAADTIAAYGTGVAGQVGLTLLCLAYAPNLAGWAVAYLVGPGFAVGTETAVRTGEVALGPLPPLPVFAGLPDGPLPTVGVVLFTLPMVAALGAGWLLARRRLRSGSRGRRPMSWRRLLAATVLAGPVAGALLGTVAVISGGPLGGGHLAVLGPTGAQAWQVAAVSSLVVAVGATVAAAATAALANVTGGTRRP